MAKKLQHVIGTNSQFEFTVETVAFDGTKTPTDVSVGVAFIYFEVEREGAKVVDKDNDTDAPGANVGITIVDGPNGILTVDLLPGDPTDGLPGAALDYALLVRIDPLVSDQRKEAIRGKIEVLAELVDVP